MHREQSFASPIQSHHNPHIGPTRARTLEKLHTSGYTIRIVRGLQSIREIIAQLEEDDRRASEWWQDTQVHLQERLVPKKKPASAKPKTRQRAKGKAEN